MIRFCLVLGLVFYIWGNAPALAIGPDEIVVTVGDFSGVVRDQSGNAIAGAVLRMRSAATGREVTLQSDQDGSFRFVDLGRGQYRLTVEAVDFESVSYEIDLGSGAAPLEIKLRPDTFQEVITVTADGGLAGVRDQYNGVGRLADVSGTAIYSGKKTEVIVLENLNANTAVNNSRQVFAKVPGINVWENDGSGVQIGIAARGLNPNRSWEFNTRQNGYDISSDILGYPEAYYTPPLEAVQRIDVVRGAASLQYGTQFGGLVNFITRPAPTDRKFSFDTRQTGGSNGLFNTFNSTGGTIGKFSYSGFFNRRQADGWRRNSEYNTNTGSVTLGLKVNEKLRFALDLTVMRYLQRQPGGLTDAQFAADARQSLRPRNWFQVNWFLPALRVDYEPDANTRVNLSVFGLRGDRNSVGNIDPVATSTGAPNPDVPGTPRTVDIDQYRNFGFEVRVLRNYELFGRRNTMAGGVRYYEGRTLRQRGAGSTGNGADFAFASPSISRNLNFDSFNFAFFVENVFRVTDRLSITPGFRLERIVTAASGAPVVGNRSLTRYVPLFGIGAAFRATENTNLYANFSQAFRATHFNDIFRPDPNIVVNPELRDVRGYNADFGYRGTVAGFLNFDVSGFLLRYDGRIGQISTLNPQGQPVQLVTNVADSRNFGAETFVEIDFLKAFLGEKATSSLAVFSSVGYTNATYLTGSTRGNRVELAPEWVARTGLTFSRGHFSSTFQYSRTSEQFSNASNVRTSVDGTQGLIPSYQVFDLSGGWTKKGFSFRGGINNLTDEKYFTRRSTGYPGPGIVPADGRTFYGSVGWRF